MLHGEGTKPQDLIITYEKDEEDTKNTNLPSFLEFSGQMDIHGYHFIGKEKGLRRVLWCILFFGAIGFSIIMFRDAIRAYFTYSVYRETKDFSFPEDDIAFPTITICNKVPLIKHSYDRVRKIVDISPREYEEFHTRYLTRYSWRVPPNPLVENRILQALRKHNFTTPEQIFELFEINHKDMFENQIARLFLATKDGNSDYPTCRFDHNDRCETKLTYSLEESLCHQINFLQKNKGPRKGWRHKYKKFGNMIAVMDTQTTERFPKTLRLRTKAPYMDLIEGIVVYIHAYGKMHENAHVARVFLKPGKMHFLKIDYTEVYHLPPPYPYGCGTRKFQWIDEKQVPYTKAMCTLDCILDYKYRECGCIGWEFRGLIDLPVCNISKISCFLAKRHEAKIECNKRECPFDCIHHKYDVRVETIDFIDEHICDRANFLPDWTLNHSETKHFIRKNLVGIEVKYSNIARLEYHRPIVTWVNLIGTIGGNLGLCTGFSIIVLFQFIQYVVDYVTLIMKGRKTI